MVPTDELEDLSPRRGPRRILLGVILAAAAAGVIVFLFQPAPETNPKIEFDLELLSGAGRLTSADLAGSPVVLNFFASWCAPCREEAPVLESTFRTYRGQGVRFVGVAIMDTAEATQAFVDEFGITFPVLRDPDRKLANDLGVFGLPQTFFIGPDGRLFASSAGSELRAERGVTVLGAIDEQALVDQIEAMLADIEP